MESRLILGLKPYRLGFVCRLKLRFVAKTVAKLMRTLRHLHNFSGHELGFERFCVLGVKLRDRVHRKILRVDPRYRLTSRRDTQAPLSEAVLDQWLVMSVEN